MTSFVSSEKTFHLRAAGHRLQACALSSPEGKKAGEGPTLVFLHEGLGSIAQWKDFPRALAERTRLPAILYDRYGFGGSDPLQEPRSADYLRTEAEVALPEVLEACGIAEPVLVGHSDGGTIALLFAAAFPDRPLGIITEAAHVFVEEVTLEGIRKAVDLYFPVLREKLRRYHGLETDAVFRGWSGIWLDPRFRGWNITDRLPAIRAPLLALQGAEDEYGTPAQLEAIAAGVSGPCRVGLLEGCGHLPHVQSREEVLSEMAQFIRELTFDLGYNEINSNRKA